MSLLADRGVDAADDALRVRALGEADRGDLLRLVDADPYVNAVADLRIRVSRVIGVSRGAGTVLGVTAHDGALRAACLDVGNLLPVGGGPEEWAILGEHLRGSARTCSSIVGRRDAVASLWRDVAPTWGPARAVRESQPLLVLDRADRPAVGDDRVRTMHLSDLDRYLPAAAAMFAEELGLSIGGGNESEFRRRVAGLIASRRAFGIVEGDSVIFKADLGTLTAQTCQIQGVWVHPDLRGRGIAGAAMARVLQCALDLAPTASLYVNDFNAPARRLYARLGMTETAVLSTILF